MMQPGITRVTFRRGLGCARPTETVDQMDNQQLGGAQQHPAPKQRENEFKERPLMSQLASPVALKQE